ncbi:MAG: protein translocase subunit SecF [Spirochaetia bacterium]|jgi:preprotein translocase subunit SecF|nr:protein translocase subunit SecF [Spirochaetia bacterium]
MKHLIRFHKAFLPAVIFSAVLIAFSLIGLVTKGFNLGVDFQAGINQYIMLAYPAADVSYTGDGTPVLTIGEDTATVVFSGATVEGRTIEYDLRTVGTINDLAAAMSAEGITLAIRDGSGLSADLLVPTYQGDFILSDTPVLVHRAPKDASESFGSIDRIRSAVSAIGSVSVQNVGGKDSMQYIIRVRDDGTDRSFSEKIPGLIGAAVQKEFGAGTYVAMSTDYVGARFSQDLADNSWKVTLFTILVIMAYATFRFKFQYAVGAILAILHDAVMMVGFIVWTGMEFNTSSIAAILTILGYSINDTIVIFDRIREDKRLAPTDKYTTILDRSITETLGRTVITSVTTLLAVFALYIFTSGSIKDFALALIVGIVSGTYSTIFVATSFVLFWDHMKHRKLEAQAVHSVPVKQAH